MSAKQSVYLNPTHLKAKEVKVVTTGVAVWRLKNDPNKEMLPYSIGELMPPAGSLSQYEIIGVLCDTFREADLNVPNKLYNVDANLSTNVTLMLDDPNTNKINFGEEIFFVQKTVPEALIPVGVYVATPKSKAGANPKLYAGRTVMEYNRNVQRQITVNLAINHLP